MKNSLPFKIKDATNVYLYLRASCQGPPPNIPFLILNNRKEEKKRKEKRKKKSDCIPAEARGQPDNFKCYLRKCVYPSPERTSHSGQTGQLLTAPGIPLSPSPQYRHYKNETPCPTFLHSFWGIKLRCHVYKVSALLTDLSPQPPSIVNS